MCSLFPLPINKEQNLAHFSGLANFQCWYKCQLQIPFSHQVDMWLWLWTWSPVETDTADWGDIRSCLRLAQRWREYVASLVYLWVRLLESAVLSMWIKCAAQGKSWSLLIHMPVFSSRILLASTQSLSFWGNNSGIVNTQTHAPPPTHRYNCYSVSIPYVHSIHQSVYFIRCTHIIQGTYSPSILSILS